MRVAVIGSGAVGGYYGALLSRAGHDVTFVARGAHLDAIRASGLRVRGPLGEWTVQARAEQDTAAIGVVDLALFAVKTYDNASALPLLPPLVGKSTDVLTLQNGVDSPDDVAAVVGQEAGDRRRHLHRDRAGGSRRDRADRHVSPHRVRRGVRSGRVGDAARRPPARRACRRRCRIRAGRPTGACRCGRSSRTWRPLPG